ncbi:MULTISPECIES: PepSY-associated TM helix domain-containing protein [Flavobacteriales]|uniref:PepSY domain-containing protein n=1 Tax=Flavobacterium microcysteis TaxID=2596891 RepID=A0A501Q8R5_9FLAO|nr:MULTISPECIES: PepSY-associated TM helix domain-containing protein [Flavobacteriales]AZA58618.1 PepSY domain-containing protein [Chryseobacterium shandongense]TPD68487.1 PepSY domain-containing protein [Flavobacterium microcysteis]
MKNRNKNTWQRTRKLFNDIHLWLGLTSGIIVFIICLSGTLYVFNTELTELGASHLYKVSIPKGEERKMPDTFLETVTKHTGGNVSSVRIPNDANRTYTYVVRKEGDKSRFGTSYMVNPYNGELLGSSQDENAVRDFMGIMFSLHRWLLLDKVEKPIIDGIENRKLGSMISGWATIIFTLGCITGLVIWFPQKVKSWKQGLKIKVAGNWKRTNHDLHNSLGFYSLILLLIMGLTGPQWSFPWYRTGLQKALGTYKPETETTRDGGSKNKQTEYPQKEKEALIDKVPLLTLKELIAVADTNLPYSGDYVISLPKSPDEPIQFSKTKVGFFASAASDKVSLNAYTGSLISIDIFAEKPFNERVAGSIKALHIGNVYGTFSKILYFIACLIATSLPITGTLIWINKLKKKRKKSNRKNMEVIINEK